MLDLKSQENEKVAIYCKENGHYNAGASRVYYAAFQFIVNFLKQNSFDYDAYAKTISIDPQKKFAHGTLSGAIRKYIADNFKETKASNEIANKMNLMMQLYSKRKKADYDDEKIQEEELAMSINSLNEIKCSINKIPNLAKKKK